MDIRTIIKKKITNNFNKYLGKWPYPLESWQQQTKDDVVGSRGNKIFFPSE